MSRSKAEISITKRIILDLIHFKTRNNYNFYAGNDYIASALDLTKNTTKTLINTLIREGYISKSYDKKGRRVLSNTDKPYKKLFEDYTGLDKKVLKYERDDALRDAEYYQQEFTGMSLQNETLLTENTDLKIENSKLLYQITTLQNRINDIEECFRVCGYTIEDMNTAIAKAKNKSLFKM